MRQARSAARPGLEPRLRRAQRGRDGPHLVRRLTSRSGQNGSGATSRRTPRASSSMARPSGKLRGHLDARAPQLRAARAAITAATVGRPAPRLDLAREPRPGQHPVHARLLAGAVQLEVAHHQHRRRPPPARTGTGRARRSPWRRACPRRSRTRRRGQAGPGRAQPRRARARGGPRRQRARTVPARHATPSAGHVEAGAPSGRAAPRGPGAAGLGRGQEGEQHQQRQQAPLAHAQVLEQGDHGGGHEEPDHQRRRPDAAPGSTSTSAS